MKTNEGYRAMRDKIGVEGLITECIHHRQELIEVLHRVAKRLADGRSVDGVMRGELAAAVSAGKIWEEAVCYSLHLSGDLTVAKPIEMARILEEVLGREGAG